MGQKGPKLDQKGLKNRRKTTCFFQTAITQELKVTKTPKVGLKLKIFAITLM